MLRLIAVAAVASLSIGAAWPAAAVPGMARDAVAQQDLAFVPLTAKTYAAATAKPGVQLVLFISHMSENNGQGAGETGTPSRRAIAQLRVARFSDAARQGTMFYTFLIDDSLSFASHLGVRSEATVFIYKDGKLVTKINGPTVDSRYASSINVLFP